MASVVSVNTSLTKGVVKHPVPSIEIKLNHGVQGDAHAGNWHRQISLLAIESYHKMIYEDKMLPIGSFAENITTEGIELFTLPIGTKLQIGETIQEVTQIGKKCHLGCEIQQLVGNCVMPKEGIFTIVIQEGTIQKGDIITIIS